MESSSQEIKPQQGMDVLNSWQVSALESRRESSIPIFLYLVTASLIRRFFMPT